MQRGIMAVAARFALIFKVTIFIFTYGYLFAYMQRIVSCSAQGEDDVPDFPDVTEFWSDIFQPFLLFTGTVVISFAPAIAVAVWMRDSEFFWLDHASVQLWRCRWCCWPAFVP